MYPLIHTSIHTSNYLFIHSSMASTVIQIRLVLHRSHLTCKSIADKAIVSQIFVRVQLNTNLCYNPNTRSTHCKCLTIVYEYFFLNYYEFPVHPIREYETRVSPRWVMIAWTK